MEKDKSVKPEERKKEFRVRTKAFAGMIIRFYIGLNKQREELRVIGRQLIRSGTSGVANYREASRSRSNEEFVPKIDLCCQSVHHPVRKSLYASAS